MKHSSLLQVFVFDVGGKQWKSYDWSVVTTVAAFGKYDPELLCFAHSKGARLVLKGDVSLDYIVDPTNRTAWISGQVDLAKKQFMDGINIDIEHEVQDGSPEYYALTALVKETTEAFHEEIPGSQVSFDVAWSPRCIDKRCYNYITIAESCDLLFVMSYDEQSQIWGDCIAMANAPYNQTLAGYTDYLKMNIDPKKLVMGVPWYGYDYACLEFTQDDQGQIHQVWYDDPKSISQKAAYVKEQGLRGIGMWNGNLLDYSDDPVAELQSKEMWNALKPGAVGKL
ncbi:Di-N-acetylchitobiase [Acipenser ruthenus]|uniref:Di-N-acetylchitobiase n=1 Tax=Acipenser ruthenus TaxID=7906 RepID=A0A662YTT0_ACIRT|nr:Di-N-acetylchitobiase [Acipenser ruthenus]